MIRRTAVLLKILRSQNIPAALQRLLEFVEIPSWLWICNMALWSVGLRISLEWVKMMRVKKVINEKWWLMVAIAGGCRS